jgi:hypothetical protein
MPKVVNLKSRPIVVMMLDLDGLGPSARHIGGKKVVNGDDFATRVGYDLELIPSNQWLGS